MDIFVEVSKENYINLKKAFSQFGLSLFDMTESNFLSNDNMEVFSFGRSPVSIDIIKKISGVTFEEVYKNAIEDLFEEIPMRIIHINDLKKNKSSTGRAKDINDLENL